MRKVVFLDRDGTINVEKNYLHKIEDFEYENNVVEALKIISEKGFDVIIVTNQAGIARGYYTVDQYKKLEGFIEDDLRNRNIRILKTYYCPHHPNGINEFAIECECRKPKPKMFIDAINEFGIDVKNSFMVGDKLTDIEPTIELGIESYLVMTGYGEKEKKEYENLEEMKNKKINIKYCKNLLEFSQLLEK